MRTARTTVSLPVPLAQWAATEARANGIGVSAFVTALVMAAKGEQAADFRDAYARHERALRGAERVLCELTCATIDQAQGIHENAKRRIRDSFTAFVGALDGKEPA